MTRLFKSHHKRKVTSLNGLWRFKIDPDRAGESEKWYADFPKDSRAVLVPGCWNTELGLYHYEGGAWYQREFETTKAGPTWFSRLYGLIRVCVDGKEVGSQYGGFAGYQCLVRAWLGKTQSGGFTDNSHNDRNTILARVDWFHYGGLFRSVELMELEDAWIKDCRIDYRLDIAQATAHLDLHVAIQNSPFPGGAESVFG